LIYTGNFYFGILLPGKKSFSRSELTRVLRHGLCLQPMKPTANEAYSQVKLETAKKGFYFNGGKLYNELPLENRKSDTLRLFTKGLSKHLAI
jgi:hypothetical protein